MDKFGFNSLCLFAESLAKQFDRDMRHSVRETGKRPRDAFSDMMVSIPKKVKTSEKQAEVVEKMPSYTDVRRQLCRHRVHRCTPVPDPLDLPDELRITLRGREADAADPNYHEPFVLYTGQDGQSSAIFICNLSQNHNFCLPLLN